MKKGTWMDRGERIVETKKKIEYDPKTCPDFKKCKYWVTKHYFETICNRKDFIKCYHFSKERNLLKKPIDWLVSLAVEADAIISTEQGWLHEKT